MQNPFRSEAEAFRFLIRTIAYFAVIAVAALINTWLGVAVFVIATGVIVWWLFFRGDAKRPIQTAPTRHGGDGERRILVIANETVGGAALRDRIHSHTAAAVRMTNTATPSHVAIAAAATISAKYPTVNSRKR